MKKLRFLSVLLLLCALPLCAFAMDEGYLDSSTKWNDTGDAVFISLDPERLGGDLVEGFYQYYTDLSDNCFYLHISYTENSLEGNGDNEIYLDFNVKNNSNEYRFRSDEIPNAFNVRSEFSGILANGQDIYIGIEFLNKEDKKLNNYLSFSLTVNGYKYELCNNGIELAYGDYAESLTTTKPSTTKESTTKISTTKETTTKQTTTKKETTTKFKYTYTTTTTKPTERNSNTTTEKTTKPKTETTTKFKYEGTATPASSEKYTNGTAPDDNTNESGDVFEENTTAPNAQSETNDTENTIIIPTTNNAEKRSPQAKFLSAMAVIFAVGGCAFIARGVSLKTNKSAESSETE